MEAGVFNMVENWYPGKVRVGPEGTPGTYEFMQSCFEEQAYFSYAELGVYNADTAKHVCELFPNCTLYLFDFDDTIDQAKVKLSAYQNKIHYFGNSQRYNDSYNWQLLKLIGSNSGRPIFDYVFLDGAHTVAVDALSFFLSDRLLRIGGYLDFDDYNWRLRGSSLDPELVNVIADQYTEEQIDAYQVRLIVDELVRRTLGYDEVVENKVFCKTKPSESILKSGLLKDQKT